MRRLLIVTLMGLLLALPATSQAVAESLSGAQPPTTTEPTEPGQTAPSGPELEEPESEEDQAEDRRKLVMGIASVVLIGIVIWGRSVRRKRDKAKKG